jgi:hypothetical protein
MLREAGQEVTDYDPMFAPDAAAVAAGAQYDFVTCTEVAEHFYRPAQEFDHMAGRYNLNPADPSARFQTLNLSGDILVSKFAFKFKLYRRYAMAALVRPGGLLAVLTSFQPAGAGEFAKWHYRRDPTHVVFYAGDTLALLAEVGAVRESSLTHSLNAPPGFNPCA